MTPLVDKLQNEFNNLHKVNVANEKDIAKKFGVMGTPALILLENSTIASYQLGIKNEGFIRKLLA